MLINYGKLVKYGALTVLLNLSLLNGQNATVKIKNERGAQIQIGGFTLNTDQNITINAIGAGGEKEIKRITNFQVDPKNMFAYAWIINARTRALVWRMTISNTKGDWWDKWNRTFNESIHLEKGEYEVYYSAVEPSYYSMEGGFVTWGKIMDKIFGNDDWWEDHSSEWKIDISNVDEVFEKTAVLKYQNAVKNSLIIDLTVIGDGEKKSSGFTLRKPANLEIYAIGEGWDNEMYDYAYILDANSRKRVWEMTFRNTEHAGGAIKNRVVREKLDLNVGDYIVYFQSDDNHSAQNWNANPPYDPQFWGVSVSGIGDNFDRSVVETYAEREGALVVRLDKLGDYEEVSEGFTVVRPMKLRIYALGEGSNGKMVDYGWIENAQTGQQIWKMNYYDTEEAGGSAKNRRYDRIQNFEPGSYIVYFVTDDTHSYEEFNQKPPDDPESWGIRLYSIGRKDDNNYVRRYNPERDKNIIVQLIRIGDDEHARQKFTIKNDTNVRIYAIGEGDWDEMYDYGWIEDYKTGRVVWKMSYQETRRAGGHSKNRLFDGTISLKSGTYVAHFQTDDTHAFGSWNTDPPRDEASWGITIYTFENK